MIKIIVFFIGLFFITASFSDEQNIKKPEYSSDSLNKNLINHNWKIESTRLYNNNDYTIEIYTLYSDRKVFLTQPPNDWLLKCIITYVKNNIENTECRLP